MKFPRAFGFALCLSVLLLATATVRSQNEKSTINKNAPQASAQDEKTQKRLPPYYGQVNLSEAQRDQVYVLQAKYRDELEDLQKKLDAVRAKRDREIESVLNRDQKSKLAELIANAKTRSAKAKAAKSAQAKGQ